MYSRNLKYANLTSILSTTQYPFRILYLPTQIQMDIVYLKLGLNASFQDFWCTNINNLLICLKSKKYIFKGLHTTQSRLMSIWQPFHKTFFSSKHLLTIIYHSLICSAMHISVSLDDSGDQICLSIWLYFSISQVVTGTSSSIALSVVLLTNCQGTLAPQIVCMIFPKRGHMLSIRT